VILDHCSTPRWESGIGFGNEVEPAVYEEGSVPGRWAKSSGLARVNDQGDDIIVHGRRHLGKKRNKLGIDVRREVEEVFEDGSLDYGHARLELFHDAVNEDFLEMVRR
jgi:hypothetical protein